MKKVLVVFAAVATAVALSQSAFAGSIGASTAINFTCSGQGVAGPGNTSLPVGGGCTDYTTGSGKNLKTYEGLKNWSNVWYQESASGNSTYKVQSLTTSSANPGNPYVNKNNPGNGKLSSAAGNLTYNSDDGFNYSAGQTSATVSTSTGDRIPTLNSGNGGGIKQLEISDGTGTFDFSGFFFGESTSNTTLSYMIFGYDGNTLAYCIDSAGDSCIGNLSGDWAAYTPTGTVGANSIYYSLLSLPNGDANKPVTTVYIDTKVPSGDVQYLDNFLVSRTPEPDSLILLGSGFGLVGLMVFLRHRRSASCQAAG